MAITYPVAPESRWAVLQVSTGEIISRNKPWPRDDGGEIQGLDPDFVHLMHVTDTQPQVDTRLYVIEGTESVDEANNELRLTWAAVKRPVEEQKAAAENEESAQLTKHINVARELVQTRLMVGAILSYIVDAQQFPPKVQDMSDAYVAKATKLFRNRDRLDEILAQIDADQEPDLDAGWEPED